MTQAVKPVPKGCNTVTAHLTVRNMAQAIDFYQRAFGAEEFMRMPGPDGQSIMHAEIKLGDSLVFLAEEHPHMGCRSPLSLGGTPVTLNLYVADVDALFQRAVKAGAQAIMPP